MGTRGHHELESFRADDGRAVTSFVGRGSLTIASPEGLWTKRPRS